MPWCLTASCLKLHFFQFSLTPSKIKVLAHTSPPLYLDYSDKMFFIFLTWFTLISQAYNNRIYSAVPESREHLQHEKKAHCLQMGFPRQGSVKLNISGSTTAENRYFRVETELLLYSETQVRDGTHSCRTSLSVFSLSPGLFTQPVPWNSAHRKL